MSITDLDPHAAAEQMLAEGAGPEWIARLASELDRLLAGGQLSRIMSSWDLSRTELGAMFGVSRQAVTKWLTEGVPADRAPLAADLAAICDLLEHYLKPDRISAVVRRASPGLGDRSLLELVSDGETAAALDVARRMFAFGDVHR